MARALVCAHAHADADARARRYIVRYYELEETRSRRRLEAGDSRPPVEEICCDLINETDPAALGVRGVRSLPNSILHQPRLGFRKATPALLKSFGGAPGTFGAAGCNGTRAVRALARCEHWSAAVPRTDSEQKPHAYVPS